MKTPNRYEYGVDYLWIPPYFQTREDYEARTGKICPAYDPSKRIKKWAGEMPVPAKLNVPFDFVNAQGAYDAAVMPLSEWMNVNIPPTGVTNVQVRPEGEWQVPCRPLLAEEKIVLGFGGVVLVRNANFAPVTQGQTPAGSDNSAILVEMNGKLDKIIAALNI